MKQDTIAQRHRIIDNMIRKGFDFEESLIHNKEEGDDWGGVMSTVENLIAVEEMIRTEQIFMDVFIETANIRSRDEHAQGIYLGIVDESLINFVDGILLRRIEHAFDHLHEWNFVSERGKKFQKNYCKKLDTLIKKYQDTYDL